MPPKKAAAAKAKTPVKKPAATAATPATVTNAKGKEFEATAAAGRERRAPAPTTSTTFAAAPAKKTPAKKAAAATTTTTGKKRGRPAKADATETEAEPPKKRGRPSKAASSAGPAKAAPAKKATPAKKSAPAKKPIAKKAAPAVPVDGAAPPPRKRGRPPKGGETTQVEVGEEAAAEQLEDELEDAVEDDGAAEPSKRKSPAVLKKGKAAAKSKGKEAVEEEDEIDDADADVESTGKRYWLMKAEQEDREETLKDGSVFNSKFTIDDLRDKAGPEPWDGVRNPTANKNMKDMQLGDLAFFYASGGKKGRVPGITGIMEVVKEHEADPSAFDENSPYYVDTEKKRGTMENPKWSMVHVEFRNKLIKPVTLKELQKYKLEGSALANLQEFTAARLSVSKVSEDEWNFIVGDLIEGYEEDEALPTKAKQSSATANTGLDAMFGVPVIETKEAVDSELPTTDTVLAAETVATSSRPGSRAGSKKPSSRAASRVGSRANSVAPPEAGLRANSLAPPVKPRGRSRTPRAASAQPGMTTVAEEMDVVAE